MSAYRSLGDRASLAGHESSGGLVSLLEIMRDFRPWVLIDLARLGSVTLADVLPEIWSKQADSVIPPDTDVDEKFRELLKNCTELGLTCSAATIEKILKLNPTTVGQFDELATELRERLVD